MQTLAGRTFLGALRRETAQFHADAPTELHGTEGSWDIGTDEYGFCTATGRELGRLWGLIFVQAQCDGASRIQLYYGTERMVYSIEGIDYEMVPPPAPLNVDMCRLLARSSNLRWNVSGKLKVSFVALDLELVISHKGIEEKPAYIEITGFTGNTRRLNPQRLLAFRKLQFQSGHDHFQIIPGFALVAGSSQ